jgi:hypothetical protein
MLVGGVIKGCFRLAACRQFAQLISLQESAISDREAMTELGLELAGLACLSLLDTQSCIKS